MKLIIAEKPQAALKIAKALSNSAEKKNFNGIPYYKLNHKDKEIIVAPAVGHLFSLKSLSKGYPVFDFEWKVLDKGYVKKYFSLFKNLKNKVSEIIIATDYDIEGELIGFNILRFIFDRDDALRMKFSTLTKQELLESYEKVMDHIDFGQAYAGETRHKLDWLYGINLSRALMNSLRKMGTFRIMSIGRVQGPALSLIVKREKEILNFKPEKYWQIFVKVDDTELEYEKKLKNKEEAEDFKKLKGKKGIAKTEKTLKNLEPFPPFDLTTLQIESYKIFSLTPSKVLEITQNLYLNGLISYPRTSSQKLPPSINYKLILKKLIKENKKFKKFIKREKPIEGKKIDLAHPAIYPTGEKPEKLTKQEQQIYNLIVKRFIACFSEDAIIEDKKITLEIKGKIFRAKGLKIRKKGWLEVYPFRLGEKELQDLEGEVEIKKVNILEKETKPPKRYTPSSVISELAKRNLGTKGTRALILETLYKRGYIKEKSIKATELGLAIEKTLEENCPLILDEKLTRKFEEEMEKIQISREAEKREQKVLEEAKKILKKILIEFKKREEKIGSDLLKALSKIREEERRNNILIKCPLCKKGSLVIRKNRKGKKFIGCSNYPRCKITFSLPQKGSIKKLEQQGKQVFCECGFPLLVLIKKSKKPWIFCFNPECKKKTQNIKT